MSTVASTTVDLARIQFATTSLYQSVCNTATSGASPSVSGTKMKWCRVASAHNVEVFGRAALLALIVAVPVSAINLAVGSRLGIVATDYQPMKIASIEAQWNTCQPCAFSIFQIGGFSQSDQTPTFSIQVPKLLSLLATGSFDGKVEGINELQRQSQLQYGASSSHYALGVMTVAALILTPVVLLYQGWTYYVFRTRIAGEPLVTEGANP